MNIYYKISLVQMNINDKLIYFTIDINCKQEKNKNILDVFIFSIIIIYKINYNFK